MSKILIIGQQADGKISSSIAKVVTAAKAIGGDIHVALFAKDGSPKLVPTCTYPLTGVGCVTRVYTDYGLFLVGPDGVRVAETFGISLTELRDRVEVRLRTL